MLSSVRTTARVTDTQRLISEIPEIVPKAVVARAFGKMDMDGDGIDEVVVVTSQSTHLFHHDTAVVQAKVNYAVGLLEDLAALRKQGSPGLI